MQVLRPLLQQLMVTPGEPSDFRSPASTMGLS
jgi:hypothetical protein